MKTYFTPIQKGEGALMVLQNFLAVENDAVCQWLYRALPAPTHISTHTISAELAFWAFKKEEQTHFFNILKNHPRLYFLPNLLLPDANLGEITQQNDDFSAQNVDFYVPFADLVIDFTAQPFDGKKAYCRSKGLYYIYAQEAAHIMPIFEAHLQKKQFIDEGKAFQMFWDEYPNLQQFSDVINENIIYRLQLFLLNLVEAKKLAWADKTWTIHFESDLVEENVLLQKAFKNLTFWLESYFLLQNKKAENLPQELVILKGNEKNAFPKLNFSLLKRFDDNHLNDPQTIFARSGHLEKFKQYVRNINAEISIKTKLNTHFFVEKNLNFAPVLVENNLLAWENVFQKFNIQKETFEIEKPAISDFLAGKNVLLGQNSLLKSSLLPLLSLKKEPVLVLCPSDAYLFEYANTLKKISPFVFFYEGMSDDEINLAKHECLQNKCQFVLVTAAFVLRRDFLESEFLLHFFEKSSLIFEHICSICEESLHFNMMYFFAFQKIKQYFPKNQKIATIAHLKKQIIDELCAYLGVKTCFLPPQTEAIKFHLHQANGKAYLFLLNLLKKAISTANSPKILVLTPQDEGSTGAYLLSERLEYDLKTKIRFYTEKLPNELRTRESEFELEKKASLAEWENGAKQILIAKYDFALSNLLREAESVIFLGMPPQADFLFYVKNNLAENAAVHLIFSAEENFEVAEIFAHTENLDWLKNLIERAAWMRSDALNHLANLVAQNDPPEEEAIFVKNLLMRIYSGKSLNISVAEPDYRMFSARSIDRLRIMHQSLFRLFQSGHILGFERKEKDVFQIHIPSDFLFEDKEEALEKLNTFLVQKNYQILGQKVKSLFEFYAFCLHQEGEFTLLSSHQNDFYADNLLILRHLALVNFAQKTTLLAFLLTALTKNDVVPLQNYTQNLLRLYPNQADLFFITIYLDWFQGREVKQENFDLLLALFPKMIENESIYPVLINYGLAISEEKRADFSVLLCEVYPQKIAQIYEQWRDVYSLNLLLSDLEKDLEKICLEIEV